MTAPYEINRITVMGHTYSLVFTDLVIPIVNGGTGLMASPSMLIDLASNSAVDILAAAPRPGVTGVLPPANGGTGRSSIQTFRNDLGLGNTLGPLPIANGGTGVDASDPEGAEQARLNLGIQETYFVPNATLSSGNVLTAANHHEYNISGEKDSLVIKFPAWRNTESAGSVHQGIIFGVNFNSSASFTGVTFRDNSGAVITSSVKLAGDGLKTKSTRYNLICWYDGADYWCAARFG